MISTITTVISTNTTLAVTASLGTLAIVLLISLLSTKEIVTADTRPTLQMLGRRLSVSIVPLLFVFLLIVAVQVITILA